MAVNITTKFENLLFSSDISDVNISLDNPECKVSVVSEIETIYEESLFSKFYGSDDGRPKTHPVTLYNLGELIESDMKLRGLSYASYSLVAEDVFSGSKKSVSLNVIFSNYLWIQSCSGFVKDSFLSTAKAVRIPRGVNPNVSVFVSKNESLKKSVVYVASSVDGKKYNGSFIVDSSSIAEKDCVMSIKLSQDDVIEAVFRKFNVPKNEIILNKFILKMGERCISFYVDDSMNKNSFFRFRNNFNIFEDAFLNCDITEKPEIKSEVAYIDSGYVEYDRNNSLTYEVKVNAIPNNEAMWLRQMFYSNEVLRPVGVNEFKQIILSDVKNEISDAPNVVNDVSFSYQFCEKKVIFICESNKNVFDSNFDNSFD